MTQSRRQKPRKKPGANKPNRKIRKFPPSTPQVELRIDNVGGRGDGVGRAMLEIDYQSKELAFYVPFTLTGEKVTCRAEQYLGDGVAAEIVELLDPSEDRIEPVCVHFMSCGGCALQHMKEPAYLDWKTDLVKTHLRRVGLSEVPMRPIQPATPGHRRRADLVMRNTKGRLLVGFHEKRSHRIIDVTECSVLHPGISEVIPALREGLQSVIGDGEEAEAVINLAENGTDILLKLPRDLDLDGRIALTTLANDHDICRITAALTEDPGYFEPVIERRRPVVTFDHIECSPPPGAFLQATASGETSIRETVMAGLADARNVAEFFAGIGTFSLPLARGKSVTAWEIEARAVSAMTHAARRARIDHRLTAKARNLMKNPVLAKDLDPFDAALLDPPRAGAKAQIEELANSGLTRIVYVSCNPATFARDAARLCDSGFTLSFVAPIDQFLWSPHVELVGQFERNGNKEDAE